MATEPECSTDTSIVGEDTLLSLETLKESIRRKLGTAISPLPSKFKVPQMLRRHNPKAYEPEVISIGPFHRGRGDQFKHMENVKHLNLDTLFARMKINDLKEFIRRIDNEFTIRIDNETEKGIIAFEKRARDFYAEPLDDFKQNDEFIEMMILDACFVIQLVRKSVGVEKKDDDHILNMDMFRYVCHDLLLLENQLPWFVLSYLYHLTLDSDNAPKLSVVLLTAFRSLEPFWHMCDSYLEYLYHHKEDDVLHILDLIRTSIVFSFKPFEPSRKYLWCFAGKEEEEEIGLDIHPATALSEAGVIFDKGSANNLMTIKFEKGVLKIPRLAIGELTEPLFRNLIAFEQCYDGCSYEITSYAVFMGKLISSKSDIELLSRKKIIRNWLSVEDGYKFFNNLSADTTVKKFEYYQLCAEVDKYSQVGWNRHIAQLRRDYFSSPWTAISFAVGIILLLITIFQFINTILSSTVLKGIRVHELSADI